MRILFEHKGPRSPKLSIILVDWSVRESFHILDYLNHQTIPREEYEIIWIEYYSRCAKEIALGLKRCARFNAHPILDKWILMQMPSRVYYHKHLMYNVGILASSGQIVTICDSDAMVRESFVESIIKAFEQDPNIVLHLDQFRNISRRFYPFNYPSFEEVEGWGCINNTGGKPSGLSAPKDRIHYSNYGACMSATRKDLIEIGGADEDTSFVGHFCGPYDMTFRLVNAGKKEEWHQGEWLYHVWHPSQGGFGNLAGPHDGHGMATKSLETLTNGRVLPLVENPTIKRLRLSHQKGIIYSPLLYQAIPKREINGYTPESLRLKEVSYDS